MYGKWKCVPWLGPMQSSKYHKQLNRSESIEVFSILISVRGVNLLIVGDILLTVMCTARCPTGAWARSWLDTTRRAPSCRARSEAASRAWRPPTSSRPSKSIRTKTRASSRGRSATSCCRTACATSSTFHRSAPSVASCATRSARCNTSALRATTSRRSPTTERPSTTRSTRTRVLRARWRPPDRRTLRPPCPASCLRKHSRCPRRRGSPCRRTRSADGRRRTPSATSFVCAPQDIVRHLVAGAVTRGRARRPDRRTATTARTSTWRTTRATTITDRWAEWRRRCHRRCIFRVKRCRVTWFVRTVTSAIGQYVTC